MVKARQLLGKYRLVKRIGEGGFATVYRARDTIEGVDVALKIPHAKLVSEALINDFRKEVRLTASLDHPGILPIKNASFVEGHFVIASPLGRETLADRLGRRLSPRRALEYTEQLLEAVAYAHRQRVVHCDIKPENVILFEGDRLRLADFGTAKLAQRANARLPGSGTGTIGYLAPEQAFGRPSAASDVFALGLLIYQLLTGQLPDWPYDWPPPGYHRLRRVVRDDMIALLQRATAVDHTKRFGDAGLMLRSYRRIKPRVLKSNKATRRRKPNAGPTRQWRSVRFREFRRTLGRHLEARHECSNCHGPISEAMLHCPWCGRERPVHKGPSHFPRRCPRCGRGVKSDWRYCGWCYGGQIQEPSTREYDDRRYVAKCGRKACPRGDLMPFMRYCPWCRGKVTRRWKLPEGAHKPQPCRKCGSGVDREFWEFCPWCGTRARPRAAG